MGPPTSPFGRDCAIFRIRSQNRKLLTRKTIENSTLTQNLPNFKLKPGTPPVLEVENAAASARISLFGGQVLSYIPKHDMRDRLWLSKKAIWDGSKSIRGGVPICWPWFGQHPDNSQSMHGYVRTRMWQVQVSNQHENSTSLTLAPLDCQGAGFDAKASLSLRLTIGAELSMKLVTTNIDTKPFTYTCALHSYFNVEDIHKTGLSGLSGDYADKPRDFRIFPTPEPYRFTEETDRIHLTSAAKVNIISETFQIAILSAGHDSIVVWNPWHENSALLEDMENDGYRKMLCVETAITSGKSLAPGDSHVIEQIIR